MVYFFKASPPKPNHLIEINCVESSGGNGASNAGGVFTETKTKDKNYSIKNVDIFKKLKQIHEKIKRLNKTFTDPSSPHVVIFPFRGVPFSIFKSIRFALFGVKKPSVKISS